MDKQTTTTSAKGQLDIVILLVWAFFGYIIGIRSFLALILGMILIPVIHLVLLLFSTDTRKYIKPSLILLGIAILASFEWSGAVRDFLSLDDYKKYFGLSGIKVSDYIRIFNNIVFFFDRWAVIDILRLFIFPTISYGISFYAVSSVALLALSQKSAKQKLADEMKRRRPRMFNKMDFPAMRECDYATGAVPLGVDLYKRTWFERFFKRTATRGIYLPAKMLNKHVCLVGTTGSGKTVTLFNFIHTALATGKALVFVDGKGDPANIAKFKRTCRQYRREPVVITLDGATGYNPFSTGSPTELTDKLITIFDWSEEHYRLGATRFVQLLIRYMRLAGIPTTLNNIVTYSDIKLLNNHHRAAGQPKPAAPRVAEAAPESDMPSFDVPDDEAVPAASPAQQDAARVEIMERINSIDKKSISGIQDRLSTLVEGDLGGMFSAPGAVNLSELIESGGVVLFSLDSLRYPQQSKGVGRLVVNDLKNSVSAHMRRGRKPVAVIFDEYNVFASHEAVDVINKSRSAGYEAVLAFQSLSDIDKLDSGEALRRQIIQNCNTLIVQRQNDAKDAEELSKLFGTYETMETTFQQTRDGEAGAGSVRGVREFRVHPDEIKNLKTGEAFVKAGTRSGIKIHVFPN